MSPVLYNQPGIRCGRVGDRANVPDAASYVFTFNGMATIRRLIGLLGPGHAIEVMGDGINWEEARDAIDNTWTITTAWTRFHNTSGGAVFLNFAGWALTA